MHFNNPAFLPPTHLPVLSCFISFWFVYPLTSYCGYRWFYYFCLSTFLIALYLVFCWAEPCPRVPGYRALWDPGAGIGPQMGGAGSWYSCRHGPGSPRACVGPLVGGTGSQVGCLNWLKVSQIWFWPAGGWCQGPGGPGAGAILLVGGLGPDKPGCRAVVVLGLMSAHWQVGPGLRGSRGWCLLTSWWNQVLGLVPPHWWAELGPGVSDYRALGVLELFVSLLVGGFRSQGVLKPVPAHWWVRLVLGLVPAHSWLEPGSEVSGCRVLGIPGLVLVHWCVGLGPRPSGEQGHILEWL